LRRAAWVREHVPPEEAGYRERVVLAAQLAVRRSRAALEERLRSFDEQAACLARDRYPASIEVARRALLEWEAKEGAVLTAPDTHDVTAPLTLAVLAAPQPQPPAAPTLEDGELREPFWDFGPAERRALSEALAVRRAGGAHVRVVL